MIFGPRHRSLQVAAAAVVLWTAIAILPLAPAAAAATTTEFTWNMSGYETSNGGTAPAVLTQNRVENASPGPLFVMLTEVCISQFNFLLYVLHDDGYDGRFDIYRTDLGSSCPQFGTAIFFVGTRLTSDYWVYPYYMQPQSYVDKGLLCVKVTGYLPIDYAGSMSGEHHGIAPMDTALMTPSEVGQYLRVPTGTLANWRYQGRGPDFIRVGRHVRYTAADLSLWIDGMRRAGCTDPVQSRAAGMAHGRYRAPR